MSNPFLIITRRVAILLVLILILMTPIFWRMVSTTGQPLLDCPAQAAAAAATLSPVQARCGLGSSWEVNEGCWRGVYIRRGNSNLFDAEWNLLDGRRFTAQVTLDIQGNRVTGQRRRATLGGDCELINGTIGPDGVTVTGRWDCTHPEGAASGCFFAVIKCDGVTTSAPPNLNGTWSYAEGRGKVVITQTGNAVTIGLTLSDRSQAGQPSPQYTIRATLNEGRLAGSWQFNVDPFVSKRNFPYDERFAQSGRNCKNGGFQATVVNNNLIRVLASTEDPCGHGWAGLEFSR